MSEDLAGPDELTPEERDAPLTRGDLVTVNRYIEGLTQSNTWRRRGEWLLPIITALGIVLTIASIFIGLLAFSAASRASDAARATVVQAKANSEAFACIRAWAVITTERSLVLGDARQALDDANIAVVVHAFNPGALSPAGQRARLIADGLTLTRAAEAYNEVRQAHPVPPTPEFTCPG